MSKSVEKTYQVATIKKDFSPATLTSMLYGIILYIHLFLTYNSRLYTYGESKGSN